MKVGSSDVQKTSVRVVAATNVKLHEAIEKGKFREDLYYRLNTVQIDMPPLRDRKEDIVLLFRKFASDFATKYRMPHIELSSEAAHYITNYYWPGNIRQLRNFAEQVSVVEKDRVISLEKIKTYLPHNTLPVLMKKESENESNSDFRERDLLYKVLFDMKKDLNDLRALTLDLINQKDSGSLSGNTQELIQKVYQESTNESFSNQLGIITTPTNNSSLAQPYDFEDEDDFYEVQHIDDEPINLSIQEKEKELIKLALEKYNGKRKMAADELGISERTLYRKIKQYNL